MVPIRALSASADTAPYFRIDTMPWAATDLASADVVAGELVGTAVAQDREAPVHGMIRVVRPSGWRTLVAVYEPPFSVDRWFSARDEIQGARRRDPARPSALHGGGGSARRGLGPRSGRAAARRAPGPLRLDGAGGRLTPPTPWQAVVAEDPEGILAALEG